MSVKSIIISKLKEKLFKIREIEISKIIRQFPLKEKEKQLRNQRVIVKSEIKTQFQFNRLKAIKRFGNSLNAIN